ncbi:hypothetical protein C2G38_2039164 [Gigaspora rosea]|uniref:Uncharacterized protein n=1 Tax=Gigaspora rosea TaxID=44941 RepID=A0A397V2S3_9GLOM|nr:hypothetical protein C2G38_2039164 [Gigaspora rosea]
MENRCKIDPQFQTNAKHSDNLKYDSLQFKFGMKQKEYVHIDFGNELGSVEEGLKTWSSIDENIEKVYAEVKLQRFCHFLKLYDAYVVLFQLAIKEPPGNSQKMSIKQKKDSRIPLGITTPFRSIRGWVGYRMASFLQIKSRGERRFWTAICRIRFILNEDLATVRQLVNSGASPHFFQLLSDKDFNNFLILIANEKPVNFNLPNKIDDILDRQTDKFQNIPIQDLKLVISKNNLNLKELQILKKVILWLNDNQMKTEIIQKDADIVNLTRKVAELNLANKKRIKLINDLEAQIVELTCEIGTLRDNFKIAEAESSQNAIKMNDAIDKRNHTERKYNFSVAQHERKLRRRDERENDLHLQITLLRNRIQELESMLKISTRNTNEKQ